MTLFSSVHDRQGDDTRGGSGHAPGGDNGQNRRTTCPTDTGNRAALDTYCIPGRTAPCPMAGQASRAEFGIRPLDSADSSKLLSDIDADISTRPFVMRCSRTSLCYLLISSDAVMNVLGQK